MQTKALDILKKYWGYTTFKDAQAEIINSSINFIDTLGVIPTGAGKSICYQIPALVNNGKTLIVTPLLSLMKDQVTQLRKRGIAALYIYSGMSKYEIQQNIDRFIYDDTLFLFISPERLQIESFKNALPNFKLKYLVVDEAHCISQWGYDFRPSYKTIHTVKEYVADITTIALTASATKAVQQDIIESLELENTNIVIRKTYRNNLYINTIEVENKQNTLLEIIKTHRNESGLVYCSTRNYTEKIAELLQTNGILTKAYHGGMDISVRNKIQQQWINNTIPVVVCTNAFGMGIDKPNVRFVIHINTPDSIEAYYQEIGRAGRDGLPSKSYLLYRNIEWEEHQKKIDNYIPKPKYIYEVYNLLCDYYNIGAEDAPLQMHTFDIAHFAKHINTDNRKLISALRILEQEDIIKTTEGLYIASKIKCIADRSELDFVAQHYTKHNNVLQAILRLYAGIFYDDISIQEFKIAEIAEIDMQHVKEYLEQLHKMQIIIYKPAIDKTQIYFLEKRIAFYDFKLNIKLLQFLKDRYIEQLDSIKNYAINKKDCRQSFVQKYFDKNTILNNCNKCDVCLNKLKLDQNNLDTLITFIKNTHLCTLKKCTLHFSNIINIENSINYLLKNNIIKIDANGILEIYK